MPKRQLFVVPAGGGDAVQRTDVPFDVSGPIWSADGERLYFTGNELEDDDHNREATTDIYVVGRESGDAEALTANPGNDSAPALSPDGTMLAYLHCRGRGEETDVRVVGLAVDGS